MSKMKYFILACSIAFFACTDDVAGTVEDENTLAQQSSSDIAESSSSAGESQNPGSSVSGVSSSANTPKTSSSILVNIAIDTTIRMYGEGFGGGAIEPMTARSC
jgi:hypothetical protein